jgi:hypothetical protein
VRKASFRAWRLDRIGRDAELKKRAYASQQLPNRLIGCHITLPAVACDWRLGRQGGGNEADGGVDAPANQGSNRVLWGLGCLIGGVAT